MKRQTPELLRIGTEYATRVALPGGREGVPMLVRFLMTQNPCSCHTSENLDAAARLMWETDCGAVPIVDDGGRVVGVVTDRDICMAAYTTGQPLHRISVGVAMARNVVTCAADDDVEAAERAMRDGRIRRLPVVDEDGRLLGMLSLNDLAREAINTGHQGAPRTGDVTRTLAAICEPRFSLTIRSAADAARA